MQEEGKLAEAAQLFGELEVRSAYKSEATFEIWLEEDVVEVEAVVCPECAECFLYDDEDDFVAHWLKEHADADPLAHI